MSIFYAKDKAKAFGALYGNSPFETSVPGFSLIPLVVIPLLFVSAVALCWAPDVSGLLFAGAGSVAAPGPAGATPSKTPEEAADDIPKEARGIIKLLKEHRELNDRATADAIRNNRKEITSEFKEQLEKIEQAIGNAESAYNQRLDALEARQERIGDLASPTLQNRDLETEAERFSRAICNKDFGRMRSRFTDVTPEQLLAYEKAFGDYLRYSFQGAPPEIKEVLKIGTDPEGGYFVTPSRTGRIIEFVRESSPVRMFANVASIGTDRLQENYDLDEPTDGWGAEGVDPGETATPEFGEYEIPVHINDGQPSLTIPATQDPDRDLAAWLERKMRARFSRTEATAFVNGNGNKRPRGFLTYAAGTPASTSVAAYRVIEQTNSGAAGAFAATNPGDVFYTCAGLLKAEFAANARWMMSRATKFTALKLKDGQSNYLWQPDFQTDGRFGINLIGYPVSEAADMPAIAANSLSIALADWMAFYTVVDHNSGIFVLRDPYTTKGRVKIYFFRRVGGDVVNFEAGKLIKFAA